MQKVLIGILALGTVVLAVVCLMQSKELRAAREQVRASEDVRGSVAEAHESQQARLVELERVNKRLNEQVQKFAVVTTALRTNEAKQASDLTTLSQRMQALQAGGGEGEGKDGLLGKGMGDMLGKMMKDPAMREMMREQQKAMINMMYGGLFKDLKLSPEEKDKLKELLTNSQMKNIESAQGMFGDKEGVTENTTKQIADAKKQTDVEIKALLGDERFAQYQEYQKNVGERMQLDQLRNQMAGANMPLDDAQAAQMMQIMKDEKAASPAPISDDQTKMPKKDSFTAENLEKQMAWMDDYNRRVLDRASQVLTPEQLKQYQSFQEQQASMQKLGLQMAKSMFGGDKSDAGSKGTRLK
ncbi:MAG TPA: hypothetical protein VGF13_15780 [Verrucomicrobiae bacterium]